MLNVKFHHFPTLSFIPRCSLDTSPPVQLSMHPEPVGQTPVLCCQIDLRRWSQVYGWHHREKKWDFFGMETILKLQDPLKLTPTRL